MAPGPPSGPMEGEEARLLWPVVGRRISEMPYSTGKVTLCKGISIDFGNANSGFAEGYDRPIEEY